MTPQKRRDSYFVKKEQLAEEIADLQELVQCMKDGFTGAMQELARIQSGDQIMRATVDKNRQDCEMGVADLSVELGKVKDEVHLAVQDIKNNQGMLRKLRDDVSALTDQQEEMKSLLKDRCRCEPQDGLAESAKPTTEMVNGETTTSPLPKVSPMLQTFIQSLSEPMDRHKDSLYSRPTENDLSSTHCQVSTASSSDSAPTKERNDISESSKDFHKQDDRFQLGSEWLESEKQYQDDLYFLMEKMRQPLLHQEMIPREDVNIIFPSTLSLIIEKHKALSEALERRLHNWKQHNTLGEIYARITSPNEKMVDKYRQYIRGFSSSVSMFAYHLKSSPEFASFIQETISNHYPNYTNPNRIIFAPLHRIPYYVQHIKILDEITDKEHPDHYHLTSSLKQLKQFVKKINLLVKKNKTDENGNSSNISNTQHEAEINGDESARLRPPSQYAINFASPLTVKPPTVKVTANVKVESSLPESESYDISTNDSKPTLPTDGKKDSAKSVDCAISPATELVNDKEPVIRRQGRRRSLSGYMLDIPEEPSDSSRLRRSLSPSLLERVRKTESETDGAINNHRKWKDYEEDTQSTLSSLNDDSVDDTAKHLSSTISEPSSDDDGEDLSQEELDLINKQLSHNRRLDASFLGSNLKSPQRTPSFGVYGDYDWKGEGGEYVPSAIEMNILHVDISHDRWKNNPAFQLETMTQSEKTESEYHTSDDEPIPFNSPMYNDIESTVMKRHLGLDKRRRSSLGDLMVIPPQQIDKSLLIHWDNNMDSTSDDTQDDNVDRRGSVTAEKQFTEVSNQRRKFGMRRRRSIDAINPSDGGQTVGGLSTNREPVSSPRVSWADDKTTKGGNGNPNGKESTLVKHSFTSVFKRVSSTTSDERASKSNHEQHVPQDVMQQLTDIARIIVESSEKHKEPCSDV